MLADFVAFLCMRVFQSQSRLFNATLHNNGHDEVFPQPFHDGNLLSHTHWLAEEKDDNTHPSTGTSLAPLQHQGQIYVNLLGDRKEKLRRQ